jgi:hypothetical protein
MLSLYYNINLPSTPRSTKPCPPFNIRSPFLVTLMHTSQPYHTPWSNYPYTIIFNPFVAIHNALEKGILMDSERFIESNEPFKK